MFEGVIRKKGIEREYCGISTVIIPPNSDRAKHLKHCYQTATISMLGKENMDVVHDVDIDPSLLQRLKFPEDDESLGSYVVWVNIPILNRPIVVAILDGKDEMSQIEEGEFKFMQDGEDGTVTIQGLARGAQINISANSSNGKGGSMRINVGNTNGEGTLDISVSGALLIDSITSRQVATVSHEIVVNSGKEGVGSTFINMTSDEIDSRIKEGTSGYSFTQEGFEIGNGTEKAVLANALKTFMESLIDVIASQTTVTSLGPQPLVNAAGISAMKAQVSTWISEYLKIQ